MEITCCKCGYTWNYKGKSYHWASCPKCHIKNTVFIEENLKYAEIAECRNCGAEFYKKRGLSKYCSSYCQRSFAGKSGSQILHKNHNFKGENNPNWKGGISKDHYHYKKIQIERYPERIKCRDILYKAKSKGEITSPKVCEKCGNKLKLHAHHKDYSKPLDVTWLCRYCHEEIHSRSSEQISR